MPELTELRFNIELNTNTKTKLMMLAADLEVSYHEIFREAILLYALIRERAKEDGELRINDREVMILGITD